MYKNLIKVFIFCVLPFVCHHAVAQSLHFGLPVSEFYPYQIEGCEAITHDESNVLYFSTGNKLIAFKGYYELIRENKSIINSLYKGDSTFFYGGEKEYGVLSKNEDNKYFTNNKFSETDGVVTHIAKSNYGNFILSKNKVYHFKDKVARKYSFPGIADYLANVNNSTLLHDDTNGLAIFVGSEFKIVNNSRFLSAMEVVKIKSTGSGEYIVATRKNGLYLFDGENFSEFGKEYLENKVLTDLEVVDLDNRPQEIIVITEDNELISLNNSGSLVQEKLFTNKLYALHKDNVGKLYVVSKDGIHVFFYNLPFQIVDKSPDPLHGPVTIYDGKFYWGTNNGLFYSRIQESGNLVDARVRVKDTEGKVGKLDIVANTLLMSHEDGLYDILPRIGARFIPDERFYGFEDLSNDYLISFSDRNTYLLKKKRNRWRIVRQLDDFPIHPKSIALDSMDNLWLVDRDYNLLRYNFDNRKESFSLISKKANPDKIDVFELKGNAVLAKGDGLYEYNNSENQFEISDELTAIFGTQMNIDQLTNDQYGNIWYIQNGSVGIFRSSKAGGKEFKKLNIDFPFDDARQIYPYDKNNIFINNGAEVLKINLQEYSSPSADVIQVNRIVTTKANQSSDIYYDLYDNYAAIGEVDISTTESIDIYLDSELIPASEFVYSLSTEKDEFNWRSCPTDAKISFNNLTSGDYYLNIRRNSAQRTSNNLTIPISVGKSISDGNNILYLIGIISLILIAIAFFSGYNLGVRRGIKY